MTISELRAAIAAQGGSAPKNAKKAELELTLAQLMDCDTTVDCDTQVEVEVEDESLLSFLFAEETEEAVATVETATTNTATANLTTAWIALEEAVVLGTSFSLAYIRSFCDQFNVTSTATLLRALEGYASRTAIATIIGSASFQRFQGTQLESPTVDAVASAWGSNEVTLDTLMAAIVELRSEVQKLTEKM